jgi:uncharacterized protein (TIGR03382 family)
MRLRRLLCAAVFLGLAACADTAGDDVEGSADAITAAQAAGELERIIQNPTRLKGASDPVHEVRGEGGSTWTFYAYHATDTLSDADDASLFLVAGSGGEIFFVDVVSGAAAGAVPPGIVLEDAARRLARDLKGGEGPLKPQAVPGAQGVASSLGSRLAGSVGRMASALAESGFVRSVTGVARSWGTKISSYFAGSAAKETAPATLSKKVASLGESNVKVKSVAISGSTPAKPIAVRAAPTNLQILSSKTTGPVAVTLESGTALIKGRPSPTIWAPEGEILDMVPALQNVRTGAELILPHGDVPPAVAEELAKRGFRIIWIFPSRAVQGVADGSIVVRSGDAIIESTSAETSRALVRSASQYLVKGWDDQLLSKSDDELMRTPAFQIVDAVATRVREGGLLPRVQIVGTTTKSQLTRLVDRVATILAGLGTRVNAVAVMAQFDGFLADVLDAPDGGTVGATPAPTTSTEAPPVTSTSESGEPVVPETTAPPPRPGLGRKAKDDGCSAAPGSSPGAASFIGLALAAALLARRRR